MADSEVPHRERMGALRLRGVLLATIVVLYVLSVPWYRSTDAPLRIWLGLPDWVLTALACYVAAALLNAWAWWITDVRDPGERGDDDQESRGEAPR